ncbi:LutC/YkgG family protein [Actinomadura harenae]|uniref:Lactate utilization protein C n=1 Tax=Actinomadura harenae TaxID=2483351 RepID=A0A3M2M994_9ACTN|nr:LUD domain-containing protein [Actinomadura harenae]RMI46364.1 lactate utilization protein C [Actinomadura harenae]
MGSRETILVRVRSALADVPMAEGPDGVQVPRDYQRTRSGPDLIELLLDRLMDYRAVVHLDTPVAELARGRGRLMVPPGVPGEWLSGVDVARDDPPLTATELDRLDGVLTGCAVAIAETGTIVLDGGEAQGRRALTLVPDYHLCVVRREQIVRTVPEALELLDPTRPLTWISGPSATSDIELDRVEGVHGPRTLEVAIL